MEWPDILRIVLICCIVVLSLVSDLIPTKNSKNKEEFDVTIEDNYHEAKKEGMFFIVIKERMIIYWLETQDTNGNSD